MSVEPGRTLSHYRLVEIIGERGMGVVWKAEDLVLGRHVAIKVLPADRARDAERRALFLNEARLASSLSDASIVQVHELGNEGDLDFIVMELVPGVPLSRMLHGRPLPADKVAMLGQQIARALARAHRKGLLHRDLKPANVLVTPDGETKLADFGLATLVTSVGPASRTATATVTDMGDPTARSRKLVGTLEYMSPEQTRGEDLDARSDIFSLGVVLYEMATGRRPFEAETSVELATQIQKGRFVAPHELEPKIPLELNRILEKSLATSRSERYQTMEDLHVDLRRLGRDLESGSSPSFEDLYAGSGSGSAPSPALTTSRVAPRPRRRTLAAIGVAAGIAAAALAVWLAPKAFRGAPTARRVSIAPFAVEGEGVDPFVGRAVAESVAVALSPATNLDVLPVADAAPGSELRDRARAARAALQLTGTVRREGGSLTASIQLIDLSRDKLLWGGTATSSRGDTQDLAASIARSAAGQLGASFPRRYPYPIEVLDDPRFAANTDAQAIRSGWTVASSASLAGPLGRLVAAMPEDVGVRALQAFLLLQQGLSTEEPLAALDRIDPHQPYGEIFHAVNADEAGRPLSEIRARIDPVLARSDLTPACSAWVLRNRAAAERRAALLDASLDDLEKASELDRANPWTLSQLSLTLDAAGRTEPAAERAIQALALKPDFPVLVRRYVGILRRHAEWPRIAAFLADHCSRQPVDPQCFYRAAALAELGRTTDALEAVPRDAVLDGDPEAWRAAACWDAAAGDRGAAVAKLRSAAGLGVEFDPQDEPCFGTLAHDPDYVALKKRAASSHP